MNDFTFRPLNDLFRLMGNTYYYKTWFYEYWLKCFLREAKSVYDSVEKKLQHFSRILNIYFFY